MALLKCQILPRSLCVPYSRSSTEHCIQSGYTQRLFNRDLQIKNTLTKCWQTDGSTRRSSIFFEASQNILVNDDFLGFIQMCPREDVDYEGSQLQEVKSDLETQLTEVKSELAEVKSELAEVKSELESKLAEVSRSLEGKLDAVLTRLGEKEVK